MSPLVLKWFIGDFAVLRKSALKFTMVVQIGRKHLWNLILILETAMMYIIVVCTCLLYVLTNFEENSIFITWASNELIRICVIITAK